MPFRFAISNTTTSTALQTSPLCPPAPTSRHGWETITKRPSSNDIVDSSKRGLATCSGRDQHINTRARDEGMNGHGACFQQQQEAPQQVC